MKKYVWISSNTTLLASDKELCFPDIRVHEIGHNITVNDYHYSNMRKDWVIHFVFSGTGSILGEPITAPKGFLFRPDKVHNFDVSITQEHPQWEHYWVLLRGERVEDILRQAKFPTTAGAFDLKNPSSIKNLCSKIFSIDYKENINGEFLLNSFMYELFHINYNSFAGEQKKRDSKIQYVESAISFIKQNYSSKITEKDISLEVNLSSKYLYKLFKKYKDVSPTEYLNSYRIGRAKALLSDTSLSVSDIADAVGYDDPSYFVRVFKKHCALTPSRFRTQSRKNAEKAELK